MRVKPKLAEQHDGWDEEVGELELPADLSELGEQLQVDALHLTQLYPPPADNDLSLSPMPEGTNDECGKTRRRRPAAILGSGVSLVALTCVAIGISVSWPAPDKESHMVTGRSEKSVDSADKPSIPPLANLFVVTSPKGNEPIFFDLQDLTDSPRYMVPGKNAATPVSTHNTSIINTSGPHAEAYLDYIEMTSLRNVKLAF